MGTTLSNKELNDFMIEADKVKVNQSIRQSDSQTVRQSDSQTVRQSEPSHNL